jgi:branched-subunit amino acid ABC-type transport system permease component
VIHDVLLAYNRIFVIGVAFAIVAATYLLLTRTSLGLADPRRHAESRNGFLRWASARIAST